MARSKFGLILIKPKFHGWVLDADRRTQRALASLIWGQPLSPHRLAGFDARDAERVRTYVNGRVMPGDPRTIRLRSHDEIVLELGPAIPPHRSYRFQKGL